MMAGKPTIIFVLGSPASGKGTLSTRLASEHNFYHLSVGDHLRFLINGPLSQNADIVASVKSGGTIGLVGGDTIVSLLMDKIKEEMLKGYRVFLLDGFPRNLEQDEAFRKVMRKEFEADTPDLTILISCEKEVAKKRYLGRKRVDDSEELFDKRYADFEGRDMKVVELYRESLIEVKAVEGLSIEQSYEMLLDALLSDPVVKARGIL